tara:strand:- start:3502 stop:5754 length:2253 start_codon:yes stop_codon:yes gene_type:complete
MDNLERVVSVKYQLYSESLGLKTIQEPKGYKNDTRGYARDSDSKGFIVKTDIDLEFFGNGADYLYRLFSTKGIQQKCIITKYEKNKYSLSEEFKVRYIQEIDLGTLKRNSRTGSITVKATEGGLFTDIKNRESDEYDLINKESADGIDIGDIETKVFKPIPRSLFLQSLFKDEQYDYTLFSQRQLKTSDINESRSIPMTVDYLSGDIAQFPFLSASQSNLRNTSGAVNVGQVEEVGNIFFWRSDLKRTVKVKVKLKYTIKSSTSKIRYVRNTNFQVKFKISELASNGFDDVIVDSTNYIIDEFDLSGNLDVEKTIDQSFEIELDVNQSLSLTYNVFGENISPIGKTAYIILFMDVPEAIVTLEDYADYPISVSRCMKPLAFFDRIISKITGVKGLVVSSNFGNGGKYENIVVDHGLWARQFKDSRLDENNEEVSIQMKTSFKDAFESFSYLEPLCWFTFFDGNTERIRIEPATYTQQNFIGLDLGEVDNIESEVSKLDFFSNVKLGHSGSMEYEEISGLDEPNGLTEFSTINTKSKSNYEVITKIRTDAVGYESIRRKPYSKFPKEDTNRDSSLFMHDARYLEDGSYTHNLWNDTENGVQILDELPKGVFKPENLWNFRLSPMNRLYYGHGYSIKRGLYHYPKSGIRFSSSNSNQNLITKQNGIEIKENTLVVVEDIPKAKVEAEKINFTFKMSQLIETRLLGFTKINNLFVPNYFGLVKYIEKSEEKYGRLIKLDTKDEAKITLIKARL